MLYFPYLTRPISSPSRYKSYHIFHHLEQHNIRKTHTQTPFEFINLFRKNNNNNKKKHHHQKNFREFNGNTRDPSKNPQEAPLQHNNQATQRCPPLNLSSHRPTVTLREVAVPCRGCCFNNIHDYGDGESQPRRRGAAFRVSIDGKAAPVVRGFACDGGGAHGRPGNVVDEVSGVPDRAAEGSHHGRHEGDVLLALLRRRGRRRRRTEHQRAQGGRLTWHAGVRCGRRA